MQFISDGRNKNGKGNGVSAETGRYGVWGIKEAVEMGEGIREREGNKNVTGLW
jgi:hypothetical protein